MVDALISAESARMRTQMGVAFIWGLAESTVFFIVPDLWNSRLVLRNPRHGFLACFASLGGALIGGSILFRCGNDPAIASRLIAAAAYLPGISPALIDTAHISLEQHGANALFSDLFSGIPYKLFALQAPSVGVNLSLFLLVSATARLTRFLTVTGGTWLIGRVLLAKLSATIQLRIHAAGWTVFYLIYFWRMRG